MKLDRRTVLIGGGVGIGLIVGFEFWPRRIGSDLAPGPSEQAFGNFIKISKNGQVTVAVPQTETGQGIWTALPQIAADELGASWDMIAVEPAPLTRNYANPLAKEEGWPDASRITADSTSVRAFEAVLTHAAAVARAMLVGAAADRWNVDPAECETADGFVLNGGRSFTFGELAEEASGRAVPKDPPLRRTTKGRLIGQPLQRLDGPAKIDGSWRFAGDVRLAGMLFASARIAPPGGRLEMFRKEAIAAFPGIRHVAARDGWLAIVAESWWAAERALKAADPTFSGARAVTNPRHVYEQALASSRPSKWFARGDYESTVRGSTPLAATYYAAPSMHLGLECLGATARVNGSNVEIWTAAQAPSFLAGGDHVLYPLPSGEPAGRAIEPDAVPIAIELARELNRPVQLLLSQSASQNHDRVAPGALARMTALPGSGGITAAWAMRVATTDGMGSAIARLSGKSPPDRFGRTGLDGSAPPYSIPNVKIEAVHAEVPFTAGYMRGSPQREFAFFTECFVDELAHAAGMEPLAFRMSMLGGNGRLARCLQGAARLAQWDGGGPGSTMGIAGVSAFGSHIGLVASAGIGSEGQVHVDRLVAAVDCGRAVNAGLVAQQIEAGLVWALGEATIAEPEWIAGMPRARPVGTMGMPRLSDTPQILVQVIPSSEAPGGVSGLGAAVLAPAVANAVFAATRRRMRSIPFNPSVGA